MSTRPALLCVDDEPIVLHSLRDQLRRALGAEVRLELAESGEEGLEVLEELAEEGVDLALVLSDQLMPGMRGEAFFAGVHRRDPRVINVLLTGQATADAVGAAVNRARLYRYIAKPWDAHDLVLTVREALRSYAQAREIERQAEEARLAHQASLRFVPREFLGLLGRDRLVDVRFGDHIERPMHVLFSDMRGYTAMVEQKTASEAFAFINHYLQRMEAPVRDDGGFVVNIEGDALLALFPGAADAAVRAGVESFRALERLNAERAAEGERPVGMGLAVHSGPLLLGTVGGEERLQCDVVGDAVNLASRLEALTKVYGARMLLSGDTLAQVGRPLRVRQVDRVRVMGRSGTVDVYEVLDALLPRCADLRSRTRAPFEAAGAHLRAGELDAALLALREVMRADPEDRAAVLLASRCQRFQSEGLPVDWQGVVRLERK